METYPCADMWCDKDELRSKDDPVCTELEWMAFSAAPQWTEELYLDSE